MTLDYRWMRARVGETLLIVCNHGFEQMSPVQAAIQLHDEVIRVRRLLELIKSQSNQGSSSIVNQPSDIWILDH
jgi:hypothetical protein